MGLGQALDRVLEAALHIDARALGGRAGAPRLAVQSEAAHSRPNQTGPQSPQRLPGRSDTEVCLCPGVVGPASQMHEQFRD